MLHTLRAFNLSNQLFKH